MQTCTRQYYIALKNATLNIIPYCACNIIQRAHSSVRTLQCYFSLINVKITTALVTQKPAAAGTLPGKRDQN